MLIKYFCRCIGSEKVRILGLASSCCVHIGGCASAHIFAFQLHLLCLFHHHSAACPFHNPPFTVNLQALSIQL